MSPPLAVADVNKDGLDDFFVGNSLGETAALYIQKKDGKFVKTNQNLWKLDIHFEDTDAKFVDIDNDNDLDLYITSGGYNVEKNSKLLQDRIYVNDGKGNFKKGKLPKMRANTKGIAFSDFDNDGDQDIFVGSRVKYGQYPLSDKPYLLENKNGKYVNVIQEKFDDISNLKMINDVVFSDFDNDGDDDLIVIGEWMPISFFENKNGKFYKIEIDGIINVNGWFQTITASDLDKDGAINYIIGNWGSNNKFHPTKEKPLHIYADYFDDNASFDIALSKISKTGHLLPIRGKECSSQQTPFLNSKVKIFKEFATATLPEIYGSQKLEKASHFVAHTFTSIILKNKGNGNLKFKNYQDRHSFLQH